MWGAKQFMLARVVSVGGYNGEDVSYPAGFASFVGGSVKESDKIMEYFEGKPPNALYPTVMPHGVSVGVVWSSNMSYDEPSLLQEFRQASGDTHLYFYTKPSTSNTPNYDVDYPILLQKVVDIWNKHSYPNALWPDVAKRTNVPCQYNDKTSVCGHLWDETTRSYTGPCTFLHCSTLYAYDYSLGECVPIPDVAELIPDPPTPTPTPNGMTTEAIVFLVLMLIFLAISVVFVHHFSS
eukprot:gnl/Chilomastix_caulleri/2165.p1 GENE.gnl/Chilomastix_caulleri/2165~~gnl/Chilomastix_caulleri/2165.p1  ORF type:complete len:237 (+),score=66.71 gnl/Chilomastix_caulleri/2165:94-804(+)